MVALLALLGVTALLVFSSMWRGYVFSILWGWFIVPVFHLPMLGIATAIGVAMVVSFLTHQLRKEETDNTAYGEVFGLVFFYPLVFLGIGWVVHQFV